MNLNYTPEMEFSKQGREALKQDLSDFYHVTSIKLSDTPSPSVIAWAKDHRKKIIVAIQSLFDVESGILESSKFSAVKELSMALYGVYKEIYFIADLDLRQGYQKHNDSFLTSFK